MALTQVLMTLSEIEFKICLRCLASCIVVVFFVGCLRSSQVIV